MDGSQFDSVTRFLIAASSRRGVVRALGGGGLAALIGWPLGAFDANAKKKHKKKPKPKPNAFGCLDVGDACNSAEQCCSGICDGKKGKRQCRAHDAGVCRQDAPGVCREVNPALALCAIECLCVRTTAGSNVCAEGIGPLLSQCADCQKDADCLALGLPPGTACAPVSEGNCTGACEESGMACMLPCGSQLPEPTE